MLDNKADELENVEICTHESIECRCRCHHEPLEHEPACCTPCYRCGFRKAIPGGDWRRAFIRPEDTR